MLILHGRYMKDWWETAYTKVNSICTREEVMKALNKTLALTPETYALMENTSAISYSGMVSTKVQCSNRIMSYTDFACPDTC